MKRFEWVGNKIMVYALLFLATTIFTIGEAEAAGQAVPDAPVLFKQYCADCHGKDRLGVIGPALLPQNLKRVRRKIAKKTIINGLEATQMPAFGKVLRDEEIDALVKMIYTPLEKMPKWGEAEIAKSRILTPAEQKTGKPIWDADPMNVFVVVETGDHHISILNGDTFERMHRFKSRYALHGGPKFTSDGRYVYFGSRDGWITKFDLYTLKVVAEVRAGINMRNIAVSSDNKTLIAANYLPHTLVLFNAEDLSLIKIIPVKNKNGTSRVSAVYNAAPRHSFIAALKDIKEVWEIPYNTNSSWKEWQHDYREDSGDQETENHFPVRRIKLKDYLDDFFFNQSYDYLMGSSRGADKKSRKGQVIDLLIGKKVAELDLSGMPHLGSGITFDYKGRRVMATPNIRGGDISVIDLESWKVIKKIKTMGPGFFMRSHENTPFAWAGVFFGPNKDKMHIIDKRTLEIVKTLQPVPGKTFAHVEFTKNGSHALVSLWEKDGALLIYDAKTFELVKRIPMSKPSGKYNVHNKITLSEGTSH
jgi:mono/diheme cytochrome c family protein/DNA-binding beta-propeller fold protein YncE